VRTISLLAFIAALAAPAVAAQTSTTTRTAAINPAQMPDGTYTGVVQKVLDNKSLAVKLSNGTQATLKTVKDNVDFSGARPTKRSGFP